MTGIVPTSKVCMGSFPGKEVIRAEPSTPVMRNASLWAKRHSFVCWSSIIQLRECTQPDGTSPIARGQMRTSRDELTSLPMSIRLVIFCSSTSTQTTLSLRFPMTIVLPSEDHAMLRFSPSVSTVETGL